MAPPYNPNAACHIKPNVRARDGFRCTKCGKTNDQHIEETGKQLEVHRIIPGSAYAVDGCVTLCRACHGPQPRRKRGERYLAQPHRPRLIFAEIPTHLYDALNRCRVAKKWSKRTLVEEALRAYLLSEGFLSPATDEEDE